MELVNNKITFNGCYFRYYVYEKPLFLGSKKCTKKAPIRSEDMNLAISVRRAKDRLIDLCRSNTDLRIMLTLTYAIPGRSLLECNKDFRLFIRKIRYYFPDLKYVAIPELQKKRLHNRGEFAIHYHLLIDRRLDDRSKGLDFWKIQDEIWGHGHINFKTLQGSLDYSAFYIAKYLDKQFLEEMRRVRPKECHFFYYSRNLLRPVSYYGFDASVVYEIISKNISTLKHNSYNSKYTGNVEISSGFVSVTDYPLILAEITDCLDALKNASIYDMMNMKVDRPVNNQLSLNI